MPGAFLDKLSGIFDRRFIVVYWSPTFLLIILALALGGFILGPSIIMSWWSHISGIEQALLTGALLLVITLLAYLLAALNFPLVRLYEGYWPENRLSRLFCARQQKRLAIILKHLATTHSAQGIPTTEQQRFFARLYFTRYQRFPRDPALVKPTRLGNILVAAEEYPSQLYQLDTSLWWPRLAPLLPGDFRTQMDGALTPVLALLNLSLIFTFLAMGGGLAILLSNTAWWWSLVILAGGLLFAWTCYLAALNPAVDYGYFVRIAFDLYRKDIFKQMGIPAPDNLVHERLLWSALNNWLYYYTFPWEDKSLVAQMPQLAHPFYYDTHQASLSQSLDKRSQPSEESARTVREAIDGKLPETHAQT